MLVKSGGNTWPLTRKAAARAIVPMARDFILVDMMSTLVDLVLKQLSEVLKLQEVDLALHLYTLSKAIDADDRKSSINILTSISQRL